MCGGGLYALLASFPKNIFIFQNFFDSFQHTSNETGGVD